ncbi:hypothetical protein LOAG_05886 [Loa loa]|uniref:Uncharacterized protein n=1 Tax=Loa loa TaxID=7209 RepID=A0A1S0TYY3_LOALO|nr:hypothetical protein LOAG_05886 [Loa loa]EFO22602.1 hypothetical protein LOAG_05886 [Loa loa]
MVGDPKDLWVTSLPSHTPINFKRSILEINEIFELEILENRFALRRWPRKIWVDKFESTGALERLPQPSEKKARRGRSIHKAILRYVAVGPASSQSSTSDKLTEVSK